MELYNFILHMLAAVGLYQVAPPLWRAYQAWNFRRLLKKATPEQRRKFLKAVQAPLQERSQKPPSVPSKPERDATQTPLASTPSSKPEPEASKQLDESELQGNALLNEIAARKLSGDREGLSRLMRSAIADGRLELDAEMKPKLPSAAKRAKAR